MSEPKRVENFDDYPEASSNAPGESVRVPTGDSTSELPDSRSEYLAELASSDESVDDLLSGSASIDDLIEAGVLEDDSEGWGWQDPPALESPVEGDTQPASSEEVQALLEGNNRLLNRSDLNASDQPN